MAPPSGSSRHSERGEDQWRASEQSLNRQIATAWPKKLTPKTIRCVRCMNPWVRSKNMSNTIANHFYVRGPKPRVNAFLGAFLRDGLEAHVPIPADAEPSEDPAKNYRSRSEQISVDHWGAYWIGPDIYWTCGGAYGVSILGKGPDRFKPEEHQLDHVRKLD